MKIAIIRIALVLMLALSCFNSIKAQSGTALDFNGSDLPETAQYLVIPGMPELYTFTFEFDIKYKGGNQGYDRILSTTNHGFNMALDESGNLRLQSTDLDFWWTDMGYQLPLNTWQHIAVSYDITTVYLYINGVYWNEISLWNFLPVVASDWYLGACQVNLAENGNIVMDNFRFWDIPLYQDNILPNYQKCLFGNEEGLLVLYDFDEGTGNTVNDLAPYGGLTNGTTTNSPEWVTGLACIPPSYNLTYAGNGNTGGSAPADVLSPYIEDETVTVIGPGTLAKAGYAFTGWNTSSNGSGTAYSIGDTFSMPAHDVQLYAQWQLEYYTVTYSGNGNTSGSALSDTNSYTYGSAVIAVGQGTLDRDCKIFNGWNTAANGSGIAYDTGSSFNMPPNNLTLYAQWRGAYESGEIVGTAGFSNARSSINCIVFHNETPYVLFGEGAVNGRASVMKYNGNSWVYVGSPAFSAGAAEDFSMVFQDSTPYISYRDYGYGSRATVMKFDGTNWVYVGNPGFSAATANSSSLAVINGTPYMAFRDYGNSQFASVMKYDGTSWVYVGGPGFSNARAGYLSLAADSNGVLYLAFMDESNSNKASVKKFNGTSWENVGNAGFTAGTAYYTYLALNSGIPYLAFYDVGNGAKASVMRFDGTNWVYVGSPGFSACYPHNVTLEIHNGVPYVAYHDQSNSNRVTVKKYDGMDWVHIGIAANSGTTYSGKCLAVDPNGVPFVAYHDLANSSKQSVSKFSLPTFSVTYNGNGNTGGAVPIDANSPYEPCESIIVLGPETLEKTGFSFNGWNTESDGSGRSYNTGSPIIMESDSIVLYAQWSAPEFNISGNSVPIVNGDASPDTNDFTDFGLVNTGSSVSHLFTIENTGNYPLNLSGNPAVSISGKGFTLIADAPASIDTSSSATFTIAFSPDSCGIMNGTVTIQNNDIDENPFSFAISGSGVDHTAPIVPDVTDLTDECSVTAVAPTTTDNCAGSITGTTTDPLTYNSQGSYIIHWNFDDGNGNSINVNQNVIVDDITTPVTPTLADLTGECSVTALAPTTIDNCAGTITGTTTDPLTYNSQGSYIIHWNFDDGNGNSVNVDQNVIVDDITAPAAPTLADLTGECSVTAVAPTTIDNCAGTITGTTTDPLTYNSQGNYIIHWNFDDGNGNSVNVNQNVIVDDITAPATPILADLSGECSVTAIAPTTTDNCAGSITGTTSDPLTYNTQGSYIIHWNFDDGNGNSVNVNQNVIVDDITAPAAPTLADLTGECSVIAIAPTTTDNCAGNITGTTTDPLTYNSQGSYIIHWNFDDGNGNSINVNQNVIVDDITAPAAPTLVDLTGECSVTAIAPTTTDNCAGSITGTTSDPLTYNTQGSYIIHWNFDDGNGNSVNVNQNVIVDDITAPATPTLADLTGECSVIAIAPTTTDNCAGNITGTTTDPLTYNSQGSYIIHWNFDDGNGNSINVNQNVIVDDITTPVTPTLADLTGECFVSAIAPTTTDNCAGSITGTTTDPLIYNTQGSYIIHWNFADGNGNSVNVDQNVIVDDITAPAAPTLADLTGECSVTATAPTTTDNCAGSITGTTTDPLTYNSQGSYIIHWNFDDGNGNSVNVDQNVIVDDITAPAAPTLADLTGECSVTAVAPTTTDNCAGSITGTTTDPLTYNSQGSYIIHWNFDDGNGNSLNVNQNIIVDDITVPVAPTLADLTGECSVTAIAPTTTDNCAGTVTGTTTDPLTYNSQGSYIIHWNFADGNGNSINVNQNIIVDDITAPVAPTLADLSGECSVTAIAPTTTDNCAGTVTGSTTDPLTYNTQGSYIIHWNFADGNGNSVNVNQNVIVDDITAPAAPTLADLTGECSVIAIAPTTTDNCAGTVTGTTTDPLIYNTQGSYIIHWNFDDGNGNSVNVNQNVIVDDITTPVTPTLADLTGECFVSAIAPTTTDNCAGSITGTTTDPLIYNTQGSYIIHWNFDDGNGNSINVNQNVIVDDITAPAAPTLVDLTGECSVTAIAPTTIDNCAGTVTGTTTDPLIYNSQGNYIIHWNFDDGNGNSVNVNQNVIVDDITAPATPILADLSGECSVTAIAPTTTDNCAGSITGTTSDPLTYNTQGSYIIHWNFADGNGNSVNVDQNVIVDDITAPAAPTLADLTGECSVTAVAPTTTDNCAGNITGTTTDPLTYNTQGSYIIHWNFADGNGNSVNVNQNVIVDDITSPVTPTLADLTGECSVTAIAPTTTDNCAGTVTGTTTDPLTYNSQGTYIIHWNFADGNGNSVNVDQNVIVDDITTPTAPTLADLTGECSVTAITPTTTDNCTGTVTGTTTDPLTYNSQGSYIIHWNFDDGNGNSINVNQNVIVDDITTPVTPTLADLTGECFVSAIAPTTTDNCAGTITGTTTDPLTYNSQGSYIIHWNFDDGNGNSINVNQNVIVDDITAPAAPTLADLTGECSVIAIAPTTTDNCDGTITGTTADPLTYNTQGSYIIHWNFDDGNGNSVNVNQNVIVDDITAPAAPTLADLTGECSVTAIAPTTTDNCAGSITGTTTDPLTYNSQGSYIIHWNFDDGNGNSINVNQNVIVDDITTPVTPSLADLTGECSVTAIAPTTTDNCAGNIAGTTTDPLTYNTQGSYIIHWNFDDGNGNISTQNQNVFIADITDPEIACPNDRIIFLNEGETYYTIVGNELDPVSVNDNCTIDNYINSINNEQTLAGEQLAIGTTTIVWYATDIAGNTDSCSTVVQVNYLSSINEQETADHMIYPNPSNGMVKVYLNANTDYTVKVWDAQGRLIIEKLSNIKLQEINLLAAPTGVYYFQIIYNGRVINDKVIIQ